MKKLIFLFAFSIAVTNIFAQTDPNQIRKKEMTHSMLRIILWPTLSSANI